VIVADKRAILLYDADCGFCRWSVAKILAWDRRGRLRAVALQSAEADELLGTMDRERQTASWHLVAHGQVRSGGDAVAPLARLLPAGAPIAILAELAPGLTNRAYSFVAARRERLGSALGEQACSVDPAARADGEQR
jgi:predicted DCC family thiol-disulfide oxidoreductase YuxK